MIQIRNVPEALHRKLKSRAAKAGMSLSAYIIEELSRLAALPTEEELWERISSRPPVKLTKSSAELIREIRGE